MVFNIAKKPKKVKVEKVAKQVLEDDLLRDQNPLNSNELLLSLPLPTSVNHAYINTRGGGRRLSAKAMQFVKLARNITAEEIVKQKWRCEKNGVWLACDATFFFPDKRKRDSHNSFKVLFDALEGLVYTNDQFVLPRVIWCHLDRGMPRLELSIYPITYDERRGKKIL